MDCTRCCNYMGLRRSGVKGSFQGVPQIFSPSEESCPVAKHLSPSLSTFLCSLPGGDEPPSCSGAWRKGRGHVSSSPNAGEKLTLGSQSFLFPGSSLRLTRSTLARAHVPLTLGGLPVLAIFSAVIEEPVPSGSRLESLPSF